MCVKYATPKLEELLDHLDDQPPYKVEDYYQYYLADGYAHQYMPVTTREEKRVIDKAVWGLVPHWIKTPQEAKDIANMTLNAKAETIFQKPSFKNYIGSQRCLVWTNGFFEHHWDDPKGKSKTPYFIYMPDHKPFSFGGIYSYWEVPGEDEIRKFFSIITTDSNELMTEIHNNKKRMPLIITEDKRERWLGDINKEAIQELMQPLPDGILQAHTVSKLLTSRTEDRNVQAVQDYLEYPKDSLF